MSDKIRLMRGTCAKHGQILFQVASTGPTRCPSCWRPYSGRDTREILDHVASYGAADWEAARTVIELQTCDTAFRREWSPRRHRLAFCALARMYFANSRQYWLWQAVETGEVWADTGSPPLDANDIFLRLGGTTPDNLHAGEWTWLAVQCVSGAHEEEREEFDWSDRSRMSTYRYPDPVFSLRDEAETALQPAPAMIYRELVSNPFLPLTWNPEWLTSTVRDLAAHIYESREFSAMPILGDALQDAGCDHDLVLGHCRGAKLHARGCWVVDAILGKT